MAWETYSDHNLVYGVGNYGNSTQHYWIDASATDFATTINTAMSNWVYTTSYWGITTPIYYTRTYTKSSSRMDIHQSVLNNAWWGLTDWFRQSTPVNPYGIDWIWCRVWIDSDFANCGNKKGTIAHEMGHVFGLTHEYSACAVMNQELVNDWDRLLGLMDRCQPDDLYGINHLY